MIDSLQADCIRIGSEAGGKDELLLEISKIAAQSPLLTSISQQSIYEALVKREELSTTGLEDGIAIPHCCFSGLQGFVVGLIYLPKGIDFHSLDGKPSKFVFFIVGDENQRNKHIKILSSISKLANDKKLLKSLESCSEASEIHRLLTEDEENSFSAAAGQKCQMTIHIQQEALFQDVLQILSSEVDGAVSVIEAGRAGSHLHRMPLFASFWNEDDSSFSKILIATLDQKYLNDAIRRINMVRPESGHGILISVSSLLYSDGSIDF
jgi:mannitol/fructose-specific phosphotransferase system IIA component (Ntr-type)